MSYKNDMKEAAAVSNVTGVFAVIVFTVIYVLFLVTLAVGIGFISYLAYSFYAPGYEQVRYNTFKQSQAYNDGMIRDLQT